MPGVIRLNNKGLSDLIDGIKNDGGSCPELENIQNEIIEDEKFRRPVRRRETTMRVMVEEPTTGQRLEAKVGELFPKGLITEGILAEVIEFDRNHTLAEIREKCAAAGISTSGSKKEMAAKLIARGIK